MHRIATSILIASLGLTTIPVAVAGDCTGLPLSDDTGSCVGIFDQDGEHTCVGVEEYPTCTGWNHTAPDPEADCYGESDWEGCSGLHVGGGDEACVGEWSFEGCDGVAPSDLDPGLGRDLPTLPVKVGRTLGPRS